MKRDILIKKKKKKRKKRKEKEKKDEKGHHIWSRIHKYGVEVLNIHILRIKEDKWITQIEVK